MIGFYFFSFLLIEIVSFIISSKFLSDSRISTYRAFLLFKISSYLLAISSSILYRIKNVHFFLSVEEILVTERETSSSYFDDEDG